MNLTDQKNRSDFRLQELQVLLFGCSDPVCSLFHFVAIKQDMYENDINSKTEGALSMGVPGEVAGLHVAWLKHGRLPWSTLFQPAIRLARYGFIVAKYLATDIAKKEDLIMNDPGLREVYAPNGKLLQEGDVCYNVELSNSLEAIAEQGPEAFYNGIVGEKLVEDVQKAGGILTMEDLRNYRVEVPDPIVVNAMGYTIFGMPPPSSGTVGLSLVRSLTSLFSNKYNIKTLY